MVNVTNILVDMCLTKIFVKHIGYLFKQCYWMETKPIRNGQYNQYIGGFICLNNILYYTGLFRLSDNTNAANTPYTLITKDGS